MKRISGFIFFIVILSQNIFSQNAGINATGATPNASSILDLNTGNTFTSPNGKGLIIPNVLLTATNAANPVTGPVTSLLVYNTTAAGAGATAVFPGFYYWDAVSAKWIALGGGSGGLSWGLLGNAGITQPAVPVTYGTSTFGATENWMGTTDAKDVVFGTNTIERMRILQTTGNVGIGTATLMANAKLHVRGTTDGDIVFERNNAGTPQGPVLRLYHTDATPNIGDDASQITFEGQTSPGLFQQQYARIYTYMTKVADADPQGDLIFETTSKILTGSFFPKERMRITNTGAIAFNGAANYGTAGQVLTSNGNAPPTWAAAAGGGGAWLLLGNAGTVATTNFIGTTDNVPFSIKVFNTYSGKIDNTLHNTFFGYSTGNILNITTETDNTGIGYNALLGNILTTENTAVGSGALASQIVVPVSGQWNSENTAVGYNALNANKPSDSYADGFQNTAIGSQALSKVVNGYNNTAVGQGSMGVLVAAGAFNTAVGTGSLGNGNATTLAKNVAVGFSTLFSNVAPDNTALGYQALNGNTYGSQNVAVGSGALFSQAWAFGSVVTAQNDVAVGYKALNQLAGTANANGINNTAVGTSAGFRATTSTNSTFIGYKADDGSALGTLSNVTAIGANAFVTQNNSLILGSINGTNGAVASANVGIGLTAPNVSYLLTGQTSAGIPSGISLPLAGGGAGSFGINISAASANYKGIFATNSSAAAGVFYEVGTTLTGGTVVESYLSYRSGTPNTFGIYTKGGSWGGYFENGKVAITAQNPPTGTADLDVQNTTAGAGIPATVALRQSTQSQTTNDILTNLDFGASDLTTGQARIQTIRGAASGGAADLPTDMLFYTTPDASAALTERMRILNTGAVAFNGAANYGTAGQVLLSNGNAPPTWGAGSNWTLTGNNGTTASTSAIGTAVNNNFIGTIDAKDFVLATFNFERMRIASGGNIGIGTIAPLSKLDVNGGVAIGTYAGANAAPANGVIISGNVGIGTTTTAGNKLDVAGSVAIGYTGLGGPANGLIVQGNVGIGIVTAPNTLTINGSIATGFRTVIAATTLTNSDCFVVSSAAGTITLPLAGLTSSGMIIIYKNNTGAAISVNADVAGPDKIVNIGAFGAGVATLSILSGQTLRLVCNGGSGPAGIWYAF